IGDRVLSSLLNGADIDDVCAAEAARGLLPPGVLGQGVLQSVRNRAKSLADAGDVLVAGKRTSLEVDVELPDGRRLIGTVPDVVHNVVRPVTYSRLGPRPILGAWVRFLAATAAHPDRELSSAAVG